MKNKAKSLKKNWYILKSNRLFSKNKNCPSFLNLFKHPQLLAGKESKNQKVSLLQYRKIKHSTTSPEI